MHLLKICLIAFFIPIGTTCLAETVKIPEPTSLQGTFEPTAGDDSIQELNAEEAQKSFWQKVLDFFGTPSEDN